MIIAHLGIGLLILGITGSTVWQKEKIVRMNINKEININNYNIVFKEIKEITKSNYVALRGSFLVYDNKKNIVKILKPENRFYTITQNFTTEVAIHTNIVRDIYLVLGEGSKKDGWIVRVYYNPLVLWIWIGAFMIALGGVISMNSNLRKAKYL
jgi:cytochrome c-type biogenesis protein CcmF